LSPAAITSHGWKSGFCCSSTWKARRDWPNARSQGPEYRREFGAAVNFRAGLDCGLLVTGEMGSVKTEIVFLGDTVNTAARIQDFCRETGDRILASADLIDRLELADGRRQTLARRPQAARQGRRSRPLHFDESGGSGTSGQGRPRRSCARTRLG